MAGLMAGTVGGFLGPTQQSPGSEGFLSEEVTNLAGSQLAQGEVVRIVSDDAVTRSQANLPANVQGTVGVAGAVIPAGARGPVVTEGKTTILLEAGLVGVLAGQTIWVSATVAGRGTNVAPALALGIGVIKDASGYAGNNTVIADLASPVAESFAGFGPAPAAIDIGDAGSAGVSGLASRSDHEHPFPAPVAAPPAVAAASATGVATTPARSDHTHAGVSSVDGVTGPFATGTLGPSQIDAGDVAVVGTADTAARADHQHAVNTAAAGDLAAVDAGAAAAGVSPTLPRGDHKHTATTAAPVNVDKSANAAGVATSLSRSDHKHDVTTAVPAASIDIGDAAAEGVAVSLARSDHMHAFPAPVVAPPAIAAASAIGAATTPARSDHTHAGVASLTAGTGISVSAATGAVTVAATNGAPLAWGDDNVSATTTTRYLTPGRNKGTATITAGENEWPMPRAGTARNLFVRHNSAVGNGASVVYTLFVNGAATALTVTLASGAVGQASDLANTVAVAQGDRLELVATKAAAIGNGTLNVQASVEYL